MNSPIQRVSEFSRLGVCMERFHFVNTEMIATPTNSTVNESYFEATYHHAKCMGIDQ